ncbi:cyclic nucleotide-binding domain-containing protein [Romboutsia lituseburensis]|uniref:cAMP-binding domain of CRP or a regulatory subunit of cAMP-dependent protein kinases n=1 Tax=Romboutsia lituseburensis DSM 797 TaxID=1121325 RepID=A0A1G9J439_9FIRM|nr:cyclic nucleotide-binding domain-containing protein [Romboutsia lituseburensis]CEH33638.1 Cyclic nucleotide-binding domain protein [Romboutsia lituseburensis]SDL32260.1 cAMP-binding domain of CRP or a regulatory subunit of cAMP-dependent protein kinases [Romboutsia lituseburensis DSM 797]
MEIINDQFLIESYYNELNIKEIFSENMKNDMKVFKFERNEYLCTEDEDISYFAVLITGKAKVFKTLPNGRSLLLSFYKPTQLIGDLELVKNQVTTGTIQALSDCYCLAIPMNKARNELTKDMKFLKFISESLAQKLSVITMNSSVNLLYPLENRLASYINETSSVFNKKSSKYYIDFGDNLVNLAELLGSSYRHLLRTFNGLCKKGVLEKDKYGYSIIDKELLKELAGDLYQNSRFL